MRPLDDNEARYVARKWRELRIVNRILTIGAVAICLLALVAAGVGFLLAFKGGVGNALVGLFVVAMMLGLAGMFGFILFVRGRLWGAPEPASAMAFAIEGQFWERSSARSRTRQGIGETELSIPPHWLKLLRRSGARVLTAEVVDGPAETSILLSVNGVLSVSDDVTRGLLSVSDPLLPVFALLAVAALVPAALAAGASYDRDLTLWRYLKVGSAPASFSSVADLERAPPAPFGRIRLAAVTIARVGNKALVARDAPPVEVDEAPRILGDAERIRREIQSYPCAEATSDCSGDAHERHEETMTRAAAKVLEDAADWVRRLEVAGRGGFTIRGPSDLAPNLDDARAYFQEARRGLGDATERAKRRQEQVAERTKQVLGLVPAGRSRFDVHSMALESGRRVISREAEADTDQSLRAAAMKIADTARAAGTRHTLEGIFYRRPSGRTWLDVDARYSTFGLRAQAIAGVLGVLSAVLVLLSAGGIARRKKVLGELATRLPPSL